MLLEVWDATGVYLNSHTVVFTPAMTEHYPERCYHIDDDDWRHMKRLLARRIVPKNMVGQTEYRFDPAEARPFLDAAEPYRKEESDAG